jgi:predicted Zn-dependent protease
VWREDDDYRKGELQLHYDLDTAGRAGVKPTGHGSSRSLTNLVINPGDTPYEMMIRNTAKGLLVHDFLGLGQGNPINGEFSVNLFLGYKIENGKLVGRVKDVMLAGNAFDALKDITAISKEREWVSGGSYFTGLLPYYRLQIECDGQQRKVNHHQERRRRLMIEMPEATTIARQMGNSLPGNLSGF